MLTHWASWLLPMVFWFAVLAEKRSVLLLGKVWCPFPFLRMVRSYRKMLTDRPVLPAQLASQ
ncbi:hypothetical protein DJ90_6336 [Paenibacillus macerans]|uniref:Uncharacterized protein n=1 Tax=Paenibacillus macerans TaxID=44252 RepID=A0A090YA37_PAEMA|nr:hypothetical protein DJ90_6336 [Paenibacillus macerans]